MAILEATVVLPSFGLALVTTIVLFGDSAAMNIKLVRVVRHDSAAMDIGCVWTI